MFTHLAVSQRVHQARDLIDRLDPSNLSSADLAFDMLPLICFILCVIPHALACGPVLVWPLSPHQLAGITAPESKSYRAALKDSSQVV